MSSELDFAVVDVETTGLFPAYYDRIIEIAIVRMNLNGSILEEYDTLINPNRDIGPTHIHGITARDVINAPPFDDVVGDVLSNLAGAIFVAHNVHFDMGFVRSEMLKAGCELPTFPYLCTMQLARRADPDIPSRRLQDLCTHFGIPFSGAHSAQADAHATAELLTACSTKLADTTGMSLIDVCVKGDLLAAEHWPRRATTGRQHHRDAAARQAASPIPYVSRLVGRLPAGADSTPIFDSYLALLDRVLEDRRVTEEEADQLFSLADEIGMTRDEAIAAHHTYMGDLIRAALEDDVITREEKRDLDEVRALLSILSAQYAILLDHVKKERATRTDTTGSSFLAIDH